MTSQIRNVEIHEDSDDYEDYPNEPELHQQHQQQDQHGAGVSGNCDDNPLIDPPVSILRRVTTRKSPKMDCFHGHVLVCLLLDTGAESNLMGERTCTQMGL